MSSALADQTLSSTRTIFRDQPASALKRDAAPNDQSADVTAIEFDDDGSFVDRRQLDDALGSITAGRLQPNGAVVVVFIHGWHHSAQWNPETDAGDSHYRGFRRVLMGLALRDAERYGPQGLPLGRRVVGVYLGWNGDPREGVGRVLNNRFTSALTFGNRYRVAEHIGRSNSLREVLREIIAVTKGELDMGAPNESPLIFVGHSMGALILELAALALLPADGAPLAGKLGAGVARARVESGETTVVFPDLFLMLNSAADSRCAKELVARLRHHRLRRVVEFAGASYQTPLLVSASSEADWVTKFAFRVGKPLRRTDGNDSTFVTHNLVREPVGVVCRPKPNDHLAIDFGQSWHCLRSPRAENGILTSIAIDLPQPQEDRQRDECHVRYRLEPVPARPRDVPFWVFQVPTDVSGEHNDIFNPRASLLWMALMQACGAVMSLAEDWKDTFEAEEGSCEMLPAAGAPWWHRFRLRWSRRRL